MLQEALVVANHGRHCLVELADGSRHPCYFRGKGRGKNNAAVVGDRVRWRVPPGSHDGHGVVEAVLPRRNLLYRQDALRSRLFAANIDQVLIMLAATPAFSESQLARALIAAHAADIAAVIVLNKRDLPEFAPAWQRLLPYHTHSALRYTTLPLSLIATARADAAAMPAPPGLVQSFPSDDKHRLMQHLQGRATLVLGPSGVGKSTLINALAPHAWAATADISQALASGRHTTTTTSWYWLDAAKHAALLDSPGFQEFGLHHIRPNELARLMPDIGQHAARCRFHNCTHRHEPGCAVLAHVGTLQADGTQAILPSRYRIYRELFDELKSALGTFAS